MKQLFLKITLLILLTSTLFATIYSDGHNPEDWRVYTETSGTISSTRFGRIKLSGDGKNTGYRLDLNPIDQGADTIKWKMAYQENFTVYIRVDTTKGVRHLVYTPRDDDRGLRGSYILIGLGSDIYSNYPRQIVRNIKEDLKRYEPDNDLIAMRRFLIRGSGELDDIETYISSGGVYPALRDRLLYEDGEDRGTTGWRVYTQTTGTIINKWGRGGYLISLQGDHKNTGYILGDRSGSKAWHNYWSDTIQWDMNYNENFTIYIALQTQKGRRYLVYTPREDDRGINGSYIRFGLGAYVADGHWHQFSRNLKSDLKRFEPDNELIEINGFLIRGSGELDNITLMNAKPFDRARFSQLLDERNALCDPDEDCLAWLTKYLDKDIAYITYEGTTSNSQQSVLFYTLSRDSTQLQPLFSLTVEGTLPFEVQFLDDGIMEVSYEDVNVVPMTNRYDVAPVQESHLLSEEVSW